MSNSYYDTDVKPEAVDSDLYCPECDEPWTAADRHHPDHDPSPMFSESAPGYFNGTYAS